MPSWLNQHKKADLVVLSEEAGLEVNEDHTKMQLVERLDRELITNPRHQQNSAFTEYYIRRSAASPLKFKRSPSESAAETESASKSRGGRITHAPEMVNGDLPRESSGPVITRVMPHFASSEALSSPLAPTIRRTVARTPARPQSVVPHLTSDQDPYRQPLPPSPAVVADAIEEQTARLEASLGDIWKSTNISSLLLWVRAELSSVHMVQASILALEWYFLQYELLPWDYVADTPAIPLLGSVSIFIPNIFVVFTKYWLSTTALWAAINFWLPFIAGWFFNFTLKVKTKDDTAVWSATYQIDPLTFSIAKAVLTWLVYQKGLRLGAFADETVDRVVLAMPVGYSGLMVSAYVGIVTSIWDGLQGKKGWA